MFFIFNIEYLFVGRSDDEDGVVSISSHTNENVHFKEKREYVQGTHNSKKTTEL